MPQVAGFFSGCGQELPSTLSEPNTTADAGAQSPDAGVCAGPAVACSLTQGVCASSVARCGPSGYLACDASDYGPKYQANETACDGLDNDCDGVTDENCLPGYKAIAAGGYHTVVQISDDRDHLDRAIAISRIN